MKRISCFLALLLSGLSSAFVVPNSLESSEGDGAFFLFATSTAGRTYQLLAGSNQLTSIVGHNILGFRLRMNGTVAVAWPPSDATLATFDVHMGPGVDPALMTNTFATNYSGDRAQVRTGGLFIPAGSYTVGASPNAFGPDIMLSMPYSYTGGNLVFELRFSNQNITTTPSFDANTASGGPGNGWGVDYGGRWTANIAGTSGGNANFLALDFITEPGSDTNVEGIITLLDYDPFPSSQTVEIEIRDVGSVVPLESHNVTPADDGIYSFPTNLPAGNYDITCRGSHWLRGINGNVAIPESGAARADFSLVNGDADPDNEVNLVDFGTTASSFGLAEGDPGFNPMADLNGDEEVNLVDISIVSANFGQAGSD